MADVFGRMVRDYHRDDLAGQPVYERSDGDESPAHCAWYFAGPEEWGPLEDAAIEACGRRSAVRDAPGRSAAAGDAKPPDRPGVVLDAGCGPGRALDPLAERGLDVLGVDESPEATRVAREWTGHPAVVADQGTLPLAPDAVGSALFLGTHVGGAGTIDGVRELLAELDRALAPEGRIVADLIDPTVVEADDLSAYLDDRWLADGVATRRFRLRYDGETGRWRTLLVASPTALASIVEPTPWTVARIERSEDTRYLFVLERSDDRRPE